jgi:proliferating cell nuclear antigen PCNA
MFKTSQVIAFKNAIESISTLVQDVNLIITPDSGISIREMDKTGKILVSVKFEKENFDSFTFTEKLVVGIDLVALSKCLKCCCASDIVEVSFGGCTTVCFKYAKSTKTFTLKNLTIPVSDKVISPVFFDYKVCISSSIFNTWCKNLHANCERVIMTTGPDSIVFAGSSDVGTIEFGLTVGRDLEIITSEDANGAVSGCYDLKFFLLFSKCCGLSDDTIIFVKNDYPLVLQYTLQSLGELKLCLQL